MPSDYLDSASLITSGENLAAISEHQVSHLEQKDS